MDNLKPENLTWNEEEHLRILVETLKDSQEIEVQKLYMNCNNPYTFAKAHSDYVKDWEKTQKVFEENLRSGVPLPGMEGVSFNLYKEIVKFSGVIMKRKLEAVRTLYEKKFGDSIYTYIGEDGKIKGMFGAMRDIWNNR